ncbi:MAG: beta strand repeat-containing protein, partial [Candidatus Heimdallarchaeota archaeon]
MSVLFTEKVELLQVNPNGTSGFLRANSQGDIVLWDGIFTEGQTALNRQSWTGDGSTTTFAITNPVQDILMLDINGLIYPLSEYDVTGQTLTITPAVTAGYVITLTYFESLTGQGQSTGISDAINGLTNSNNVAELGGTLYKDTTINAANSSFYIHDSTYLNKTALFGVLTNINFGLANLSDYIGVYQETVTTFQAMGLDRNSDSLLIRSLNTSTNIDNTFTMDADGSSDIKINNTDPTLGVAEIHLSQGSLLMNFNNKFTITDTKTTGARTGIQYAEDYTFDGTATNLTLATKGYVDTEITGVTYTEGEGIDLTSNVFSFKNSSNLTDNFLVKWDDTNTQLASTVFQDNGTGGWAIGIDAVPNDKNSVILGFKSVNGVTTINSNVVSIGYLTNTNASTVGLDSISIGSGASAASADDIVIGSFATTILGNGGIAIGSLASATTDLASIPSIAIGTFANAIQRGEIVIGRNAATDTGPHADYSVTIGDSANSGNSGTSGFGGVTIGYNTLGTNVVIGDNASGNISIGSNSLSGSSSVAIAGTADKTESIAILGNTDQLRAVAISGTVTGTLGVVVGRFSSAGASAVAIGTSTFASANAVAIGPNSGAGTGTKNNSYVAIGQSAGSGVDIGTNAVLIGNATDATKSSGVAVGDGAQSLALNGVAIGSSAKVDDLGNDSIAILANSGVGINNVLIGTGSTIDVGKNAVGIGPNVSSTADSTVSIGDTVAVTAAGGIAIGHNINAGASGAIMMGGNVVDVLENNISNSVGFGWSGTNGIP